MVDGKVEVAVKVTTSLLQIALLGASESNSSALGRSSTPTLMELVRAFPPPLSKVHTRAETMSPSSNQLIAKVVMGCGEGP